MSKLASGVSAYMIAKNEEKNIVEAIKSVAWADEVLVVDTGSSDQTVALARQHGARVVEIPFEGFGPARIRALAECQYPWIYCQDADERCTPELEAEIKALLATNPNPIICLVPTKNFIMGRWVKHAGWYPDYRHPTFFAKSILEYQAEPVHEGYIAKGPVIKLKQARLHYPYQNMDQLLAKANHYSTLGVAKLVKKNKSASLWRALGHGSWKFIRQYFIAGGFLDGWPGFILSVNAFNETFFRYAKHYEQSLLKQ